jgi:hypothetical protein
MTEENVLDENNPKLITDMNKFLKVSNFLFPYQKGLDKSKLVIYDVCVYSMTQPLEAKIIAQTVRDIFNTIQNMDCYILNQNKPRINPNDLTITDTTANIGGNTLGFSFAFKKVNSVEFNSILFEGLENNCKLYKCNNINFYLNDCLEIVPKLKQDVIFFDPPWGGPSYKNHPSLDLFLNNKNIFDIIKEWKEQKLARIYVLKTPFNFNLDPFINEKSFENLQIQKLKKFNVIYIY